MTQRTIGIVLLVIVLGIFLFVAVQHDGTYSREELSELSDLLSEHVFSGEYHTDYWEQRIATSWGVDSSGRYVTIGVDEALQETSELSPRRLLAETEEKLLEVIAARLEGVIDEPVFGFNRLPIKCVWERPVNPA